VKGGAGTLT
jgi:hypothetical protein